MNWTHDCGGKQNYDGDLISVSTRYWPDYTAHSSILFAKSGDLNEDYITLADKYFSGTTEGHVKLKVEKWVAKQIDNISNLFGLNSPTSKSQNE